jgi:hypothetical protein
MEAKYLTSYGDEIALTPEILQMLSELGVLDEDGVPTRRLDFGGVGPDPEQKLKWLRWSGVMDDLTIARND